MELYCENLWAYKRLVTREVKIGNLVLGGSNPIRVQTMTTTDTLDTLATVEQSVRCIEAGSELIRVTAPSKREAENLRNIHDVLQKAGYTVPLVADIHFTPNAAEIAASIVEKVRVNPGNFVDKKKFEQLEYTDDEYAEEIERIRQKFVPLITICKAHNTAIRIGTNHGSLSDRIMSRYGDTARGMVESAMEFLRIAREENFHAVVLSMKSSNPLVMVQAYRLLVYQMDQEFGECYPLHLGVTEAGDGEDGRIKSAIGIGTLLEDGIGDTIRVSLTEDPEFEIPVCRELIKKYSDPPLLHDRTIVQSKLFYNPFEYKKRNTSEIINIGGKHVPVVVASFIDSIGPHDLSSVGYKYIEQTDKWEINDAAADYIFTAGNKPDFALPGTLRVICDKGAWNATDDGTVFPLFSIEEYCASSSKSSLLNFIRVEAGEVNEQFFSELEKDHTAVLCLSSISWNGMQKIRYFINLLIERNIQTPVIISVVSSESSVDAQLIQFSTQAGSLFLDGMGDGIWLTNINSIVSDNKVSGRNYHQVANNQQFLNNTAFSILQAVRQRISKTEYISCPSCGRTLFDLQETTAKIRKVTSHLKGLKIAIMGCIVNGPGEMADADFGYVGSGVGKITLYRGKEIVKRNIDSKIAVQELINLLKESEVWTEPSLNLV